MSDAFEDFAEPEPFEPRPLPELPEDAHKGDAGRLLCACGSFTMPGAAILVARAAQRAGAGLVTLACLDQRLVGVAAAMAPEAIYLDLSDTRDLMVGQLPTALRGRGDHARVAGSGLGLGGDVAELVRRLIDDPFEGPLVLDADGLAVAGDTPEVLAACSGPLVLTPHPGEAARLLGRRVPGDESGRVGAALEIARRADAICVLKGHHSIVASRERVVVIETGNPGMATAGAGDVLTGVLGAYLARWAASGAQRRELFELVATAVHAHGLAGDLAADDLGERAVTASDLVDFLPDAQLVVDGELEPGDGDGEDDGWGFGGGDDDRGGGGSPNGSSGGPDGHARERGDSRGHRAGAPRGGLRPRGR